MSQTIDVSLSIPIDDMPSSLAAAVIILSSVANKGYAAVSAMDVVDVGTAESFVLVSNIKSVIDGITGRATVAAKDAFIQSLNSDETLTDLQSLKKEDTCH